MSTKTTTPVLPDAAALDESQDTQTIFRVSFHTSTLHCGAMESGVMQISPDDGKIVIYVNRSTLKTSLCQQIRDLLKALQHKEMVPFLQTTFVDKATEKSLGFSTIITVVLTEKGQSLLERISLIVENFGWVIDKDTNDTTKTNQFLSPT